VELTTVVERIASELIALGEHETVSVKIERSAPHETAPYTYEFRFERLSQTWFATFLYVAGPPCGGTFEEQGVGLTPDGALADLREV